MQASSTSCCSSQIPFHNDFTRGNVGSISAWRKEPTYKTCFWFLPCLSDGNGSGLLQNNTCYSSQTHLSLRKKFRRFPQCTFADLRFARLLRLLERQSCVYSTLKKALNDRVASYLDGAMGSQIVKRANKGGMFYRLSNCIRRSNNNLMEYRCREAI